jgi:uncharacterized protein (UPF0332 family)
MDEYATDLWKRAKKSLSTARSIADSDPDASASRAYYAAFYAVSGLLALEGKIFNKHSAVEVAVHRDLINAGRWPEELGKIYHALVEARTTGDYGGMDHVEADTAVNAIKKAERILDAVIKEAPALESPAESSQ